MTSRTGGELALQDRQRLEAVRVAAALDEEARAACDRIARVAAALIGADAALITLVDADQQILLGRAGLPEPWATRRATPLEYCLCKHALDGTDPLVIPDARDDPRARDNLLVVEVGLRAYCGVPIITTRGHALGTACVASLTPRDWSPAEIALLTDVAALALTEIELREEIVDRRVMELALRQSAADLEHRVADRTRALQEATLNKTEAMARVSHELRAPLHGILGFAQLLQDGSAGPLNTAQQEHLRDILAGGQHLLAVLDDLLDVPRAEAGDLPVIPERHAMPALMRVIETDAAGLVAGRATRVRIAQDDAPGDVLVDARLLRQIAFNFVSNAAKYGVADGTITIRARAAGAHRWRLEVADEGPGLSAEDIASVLRPDPRLRKRRTGAGTGLGLTVTQRIAVAMGGHLGAAPNDRGGTTFYVELPREVSAS